MPRNCHTFSWAIRNGLAPCFDPDPIHSGRKWKTRSALPNHKSSPYLPSFPSPAPGPLLYFYMHTGLPNESEPRAGPSFGSIDPTLTIPSSSQDSLPQNALADWGSRMPGAIDPSFQEALGGTNIFYAASVTYPPYSVGHTLLRRIPVFHITSLGHILWPDFAHYGSRISIPGHESARTFLSS